MISVLIADDHPFFVAGVHALLTETGSIDVVGVASSGTEALALIRSCDPDVAVLDVSMPEMTGIEVAVRAQEIGARTRIVILSLFEDHLHVREALLAGSRGYVLKRSTAENLRLAIASVHQGGIYIDPAVAGKMLAGLDPAARPDANPGSAVAQPLTAREVEVLKSVALGFTTKEVAGQLGITPKSVETYKARATEKLGLSSRAKIVRYAMRQGWFETART